MTSFQIPQLDMKSFVYIYMHYYIPLYTQNNLFPRISGPAFPSYLGRNVILIGEVLQSTGQACTVKLSDGTEIVASLPIGERIET